jgi:hypothetical protein
LRTYLAPTTLGAWLSRLKVLGECGSGAPAGAVSGRDDPRSDEVSDVAHGRFDTVLDGCLGEVVAAAEDRSAGR